MTTGTHTHAAPSAKALPFVKMQGAGNDFVIIDARYGLPTELKGLVPQICDRRFGIGADGVILVQASRQADLAMTYINADGSESVCGNGMRCVGRFAIENGLLVPESKEFDLEVEHRIVRVKIHGRGERITVEMGTPTFEGAQIPTATPGEHVEETLEVDGKKFTFTAVGMGNPHCVIFVDDVASAPVTTAGPQIERHPFFPQRTNVEFVQIVSDRAIKMRIWERGVGETLACGTGICAAVAAAADLGKTGRNVAVEVPGGDLEVHWDVQTDHIRLTGPTEVVYTGVVDLLSLKSRKTGF